MRSEQFLELVSMHLQKLLTESLTVDSIDCWENERTASALRALAVRSFSQQSIESTVNDSVSSFWSCIDTNSRNCSLLN